MKWKKMVSLLMTAVITASLCACGGTASGDVQSSGNGTASETGETSDASSDADAGKVKLTALVVTSSLTEDVNTHQYLADIAEQAGVEITWEQVADSSWADKKSTLLAGGEIPDLIVGTGTVGGADFAAYPGMFEDMAPLIEAYAPNIRKMFEEKEVMRKMATSLDGAIYGIPKYQRFWPLTADHQMINKQWLDTLGLDMPTNLDELFDVLVAFKEQDPNGNGIADEIPMDWAPSANNGGFTALAMLGGYGITANYLSGDGYYMKDGQVKNFYMDEAFRDLCIFLNKCWNAGLINEEVFTQDYSKFQALSRGSGDTNAIVGFTFGFDALDRFGAILAEQYVGCAPLKPSADYTGEISWDYEYDDVNYVQNSIMMSAKCENKEAAMRYIDTFYTPENSIQVLFGSIGKCISKNDDGSYTVLPPEDETIDPGTWKWTNALADRGPMYISDDMNVTLPSDLQAVTELDAVFTPVTSKIDLENDVYPRAFMKFSQEDNNTLSLINTDVTSVTATNFSKWVTEGGAEAEWDSHLNALQNAGMPEAIEVIQKQYEAYKGN